MASIERTERSSLWITVMGRYLLSLIFAAVLIVAPARAAEEGQYKAGHGIAAYLGLLPAEMVKGHPKMHGGAPRGPHAYHLVVALFDEASGERISDAKVTARIAAPGMTGEEKSLEPMKIAGTATYGTFVTLPGFDRYTIALNVRSPGASKPIALEFVYDHRNR